MQRLTRFALDHQTLSIALLVLSSAALAAGLPRLEHAYGYTSIVGLDHPAVVTLQDMVDRFGGGIPARIRWECGEAQPCRSVTDRASLEMAAAVTSQLSRLDGVRDVTGVANSGLLVAAPGGFAVRRLVERGRAAPDAAALGRIAARDPIWAGSLVSRDLLAGTLFVMPKDSDYRTETTLVAAIDDALAPFRAQGFTFYVAGGPVDGIVAGRDLAESTARVLPATVALTALALFLLYRSWRDVAVSLGTMGVALLWTLGTLGWLGWPRDGILEVLAPLIMVVGVCDAAHVLSRYAERRADTATATADDRRRQLLDVAREVGGPCFVTTATTAAAFLSFALSDLASFQRFGVIAAFGVTVCLFLTFALLPILTSWLPMLEPRCDTTAQTQRAWATALAGWVRLGENHALAVLAASAALLLVGGAGWYKHLHIDTNWHDSFGEDSSIVQARHFAERHRFDTSTLEIELTLPSEAALETPDALARIQTFERAIAELPVVLETRSIATLISRLNRLLHDDDAAYERPGTSAAANAEILELIGFDDPDMLGLWLSLDRTHLRISASTLEGPARAKGELLRRVRELAQQHLGGGWSIRMSGSTAMDYEWTHDVQMTQVRSFPVALGWVFAIVALFLRSASLALVAMIPAVLPIVVTLGAMGWAGMSLDMGRAMIAAVLLGIAVDDSIHILSHYRLRRAKGDDPVTAIRCAVLHVGRAIVTTALSLSLGFLALAASAWQSISSFGLLVSLAILAALAVALIVLPAGVSAATTLAHWARLRSAASARAAAAPLRLPPR